MMALWSLLFSLSLAHSRVHKQSFSLHFRPSEVVIEAENGSQALKEEKRGLSAGVVREGGWDAAEERDGGGGGVGGERGGGGGGGRRGGVAEEARLPRVRRHQLAGCRRCNLLDVALGHLAAVLGRQVVHHLPPEEVRGIALGSGVSQPFMALP